MSIADEDFWALYKSVERDFESAVHTFYTNVDIGDIASKHPAVYEELNKNALFWQIVLGSLQTTFFVSLARIFDDDIDAKSLNALIKATLENPELFTKKANLRRKLKDCTERPEWLRSYIKQLWQPSLDDLRDIPRYMRPHNKKFRDVYLAIRTNVFAHTLVSKKEEIDHLFSQTVVGDIEDILEAILNALGAIRELYLNGNKIELGTHKEPHRWSSQSRVSRVLGVEGPKLVKAEVD